MTGSLVVMKSTFCSISHFISSTSSTVHTLTFAEGRELLLIHSGCFLITPHVIVQTGSTQFFQPLGGTIFV